MHQFVRLAFYGVAGRLREKTWTAAIGIPVVIHKVMKARFGYRPPKVVSMSVLASLKSHCEIKRPAGGLAHAGCNDSRIRFGLRHSDAALVPKASDTLTVLGREAVTGIHRKKPQLIRFPIIQLT